jgi:hypothetical protein
VRRLQREEHVQGQHERLGADLVHGVGVEQPVDALALNLVLAFELKAQGRSTRVSTGQL